MPPLLWCPRGRAEIPSALMRRPRTRQLEYRPATPQAGPAAPRLHRVSIQVAQMSAGWLKRHPRRPQRRRPGHKLQQLETTVLVQCELGTGQGVHVCYLVFASRSCWWCEGRIAGGSVRIVPDYDPRLAFFPFPVCGLCFKSHCVGILSGIGKSRKRLDKYMA